MKIKSLYKNYANINIDSYLYLHGIDDPDKYLLADEYGKYEHFKHYKNMDNGTDLLLSHLNDPIYLIVDCDMDGYCSASEVYLYLKHINPNIDIRYFIHHEKIHGLEDDKIFNELLNVPSSNGLLIIPDANSEESKYKDIKSKGLDILVLDHHDSDDSQYALIINNKLSSDLIYQNGSGSIVVHKFLQSLDHKLGINYSDNFFDLAMCGNIGDVMPMNNYENRYYFLKGKNNIVNPFLKSLFEKFVKEITPHNISFSLVPKINSVIRSDNNELKEDIFKAFVGIVDDFSDVVKKCGTSHQNQRNNVKKISAKLEDEINLYDKVIAIETDSLLPSYNGLIAGKLSGDYNKPCVIVQNKNNEFIGSLRSPVNIKDEFSKFESVNWCKGHQMSAGISINNMDKFKQECEQLELNLDCEKQVAFAFLNPNLIPKWIYGVFDGYNDIWAEQIEKPLFYVGNIHINSKDINVIGKSKTTLKFNIGEVSVLYFFASQKIKEDFYIGQEEDIIINLIGEFTVNEYQGYKTNQIIIHEYEIKNKNDSLKIDWESVF